MRVNVAENDDELRAMLEPALYYALQDFMEKVLDENEKAILKTVYFGRSPTPGSYQNTWEFKNAWDVSTEQGAHGKAGAHGELFYAPDKMTATPPDSAPNHMGQHYGLGESPLSGKVYEDAREYLAELIYEGRSGPAFGNGPWREKRNAFETLKKTLGKTNFKKWLASSMREMGLNIKVNRAPLTITETDKHD